MIRALQRVPLLGRRFLDPVEPSPEAASLPRHAVVCGYGRVGRQLIDALQRRSIPFLVIEYDPDLVADLRSRGAPVIYGDAASPGVMDHAGLDTASLLAALVPDSAATEVIVRRARAANPKLDIVARARDADQVASLLEAGATEVVPTRVRGWRRSDLCAAMGWVESSWTLRSPAGAGPFTSVELTDGGATAVDAHLDLRTIPGEVPDETLTAQSTPHEQMV